MINEKDSGILIIHTCFLAVSFGIGSDTGASALILTLINVNLK